MSITELFSAFASSASRATGRPYAFALCVVVVAAWAISGPIFGFSDTWQLVINTGTTIITFLMVFLIQNTQNRENAAMQAKLDEIIISLEGADNRFIGIEHLSDRDLDAIVADCERRARSATRRTSAMEEDAKGSGGRRSRETRVSAAARQALAKVAEAEKAQPKPRPAGKRAKARRRA